MLTRRTTPISSAEILSLQQAVTNQGYSADFLRKHGAADGRFYYQQGIDAVKSASAATACMAPTSTLT